MSGVTMAAVGARGSNIAPISFSAAISASGATATVTGATVTVTVPAGNPGDIRFDNVTIPSTGQPEYSKNAGTFAAITEGLVVNFADTDTLAVRARTLTSPEIVTFQAKDDATEQNIEVPNAYIERT